MFRLTPKEIKDGTEKRCGERNRKMENLFGPLFDKDCDLKTVVDVAPMPCPKGLGTVLDVENENLVERCEERGPFVERYRIELTISFQSGDGGPDYLTQYMKKGGYKFDESFQSFWQASPYTTWGPAENRAVRQRVWVQHGPYMKSSGDVAQKAKKEEGNPHDDQCNQQVPSKMNDWIEKTYRANCDFNMVVRIVQNIHTHSNLQ